MTTNALPPVLPGFQFLDNDGTPLAGGRVSTYLSGTTTPTTTWQDQAKATPNANPIVLNAYGRADIFIDQGTVYRFDVKRADDTLVDSMDPIRTPNSVSGALDFSGTVISGAVPLVFEGATVNSFDTSFAITDPTGNRTVTFPDKTGTVALLESNGDLALAAGAYVRSTSDLNIKSDYDLNIHSSDGVIRNNDGNAIVGWADGFSFAFITGGLVAGTYDASGNPAWLTKTITGVTAASVGGFTTYGTGITASRILSVYGIVEIAPDAAMPIHVTSGASAGDCFISTPIQDFTITLNVGSSAPSLTSKAFTIFIVYRA